MNVMLLVMSTKRLMEGTRDHENIIIDEHRHHSLNKNNPNDVHYLSIMFIFQHFVFTVIHLNMSYVILKCQPKSIIRFCTLQNVVKGRKDASFNNK